MFANPRKSVFESVSIIAFVLTVGVFGSEISRAATLSAEGSDAFSVTLSWTAPGDDGDQGTAAQYDIRYSTQLLTEENWDAAVQVVGEPTPLPAGTVQQMTITGLADNTTYYFAMKAADEVPNWSAMSNVVTVDRHTPDPLTDLEAGMGMNQGDLDLSWTTTGDDGSSGTASYYLILYDTDSITTANWTEASQWPAPPTPLPAGQNQSVTLTGLTPGTEYFVACIVLDEVGNASPISNVARGVAKYSIVVDADDEDNSTPHEFALRQNYPNPFNPSTTIEYSISSASHVTVSVFNSLGQRTRTLVNQRQESGRHVIHWDGTDANGRSVASGIYLYRIQAGSLTETRKMALMR